jgi:hypothetical protein
MVGPAVAATELPVGGKWSAYSGSVGQFASIPAFVELIVIPSTGLKDSYVKVFPFFGAPTTTAKGDALGIEILIDSATVYKQQSGRSGVAFDALGTAPIELFVPKQSKLEVQSINTANNTLQFRGVCVLGWALE